MLQILKFLKPLGKETTGEIKADGRMILRLIFRRWDVEVWTGLSWLRVETDGGHLCMR
jgi:hypothetical protein